MAEQEQARNISDIEAELIRSTITDDLLKSVRGLFLGLEVSEAEKRSIKSTFSSEELLAIVTRRFYPELSKDTDIGQVQDSWLGAEQMVFGQSPEVIYQALQYKELALQHTKQALGLLANPDGAQLDLSYNANKYPNDTQAINLLARNQFIRHVENQLLFLSLISKQKVATPEQTQSKARKDSTK